MSRKFRRFQIYYFNQKTSPKNAFAAIKKKMNSPNPHSSCYSLLVLESIVKNCGAPVHEEVFTKENCEMFSSFLESTPHENVRQKMLELVQTWAYAFRSSDKYQAIKVGLRAPSKGIFTMRLMHLEKDCGFLYTFALNITLCISPAHLV